MHTFSILSHFSTCPYHSSTFDFVCSFIVKLEHFAGKTGTKKKTKSILAFSSHVLHSLAFYLNSIFMRCGLLEFQLFHSTASVLLPAASFSSFERNEFITLHRKGRQVKQKTRELSHLYQFEKTNRLTLICIKY